MFSFGAAFPDGITITDCKVTWGARAIFKGYSDYIDLLPDRQQMECPEDVDDPQARKALSAWINGKGLPALRKWSKNIAQGSCEEFLFEDDRFAIRATPNASYGYMYIRAWLRKEEELCSA